MKMINPTTITDAILVSSTRAEDDYAAWSAATTYAAGDRCIVVATHRIYQSVQAGNINHNPVGDDGTWWVDIGPTNRWAMFDRTVGTVTAQSSPLTVVLDPGRIDALALLDSIGRSVVVTMEATPGGDIVYDKNFSLLDVVVPIVSWWTFFTAYFEQKETLVVDDLPPYSGGRLTVSIFAATTASCGTLVVGRQVSIGQTLSRPKIGITDYSRKITDENYGVTSVVERAYSKRATLDVLVPALQVDYVAKMLSAIRATPVVWVCDDSGAYESLIIFGWVKDWDVVIAYATYSEAQLTIEGLV